MKLSLKNYFNTIQIVGASPIEKGPLLVVANHPNYLLDPLLVAISYKRPLWFMAKAVIFNRFTYTLLHALHAIPIYRRSDNPQLMHRNEQSFEHAIERLNRGGAILIFPEGISINQREFEPIKTGAARMALQALESSPDQEILIQPVGLTYAGFHRVRTGVTITFGEPIQIKEYAMGKSQKEKVSKLTERIENDLATLTVQIEQEDVAKLIEKISTLYSSLLPHNDYRIRFKKVKENLLLLGEDLKPHRETLEPRIDNFLSLLKAFGFGEGTTLEQKKYTELFLLLIPFHIIGWMTQYVPFKLTSTILSRRNKDHMTGSLRFSFGFLLFWIWYGLLMMLLYATTQNVLTTMTTSLLIIGSVIVYNSYRDQSRIALLDLLWPGKTNPLSMLRLIQRELINDLESLRKI